MVNVVSACPSDLVPEKSLSFDRQSPTRICLYVFYARVD